MSEIYGYARCSTNDDKQDITRQIEELKKLGCKRIESAHMSGLLHSECLDTLIEKMPLKSTLAALELTRLTRSVHELCHLYEKARKKRLKIKAGSLEIDFRHGEAEAMHKTLGYMLVALGELEVGTTKERIMSGLRHARAAGKRLGRPRRKLDKLSPDIIAVLADETLSNAHAAEKLGLSRSTVARYRKMLAENDTIA